MPHVPAIRTSSISLPEHFAISKLVSVNIHKTVIRSDAASGAPEDSWTVIVEGDACEVAQQPPARFTTLAGRRLKHLLVRGALLLAFLAIACVLWGVLDGPFPLLPLIGAAFIVLLAAQDMPNSRTTPARRFDGIQAPVNAETARLLFTHVTAEDRDILFETRASQPDLVAPMVGVLIEQYQQQEREQFEHEQLCAERLRRAAAERRAARRTQALEILNGKRTPPAAAPTDR